MLLWLFLFFSFFFQACNRPVSITGEYALEIANQSEYNNNNDNYNKQR